MNRQGWVVAGGIAITFWGVTGALGGCKSAPAPTASGSSSGSLGDDDGTSGNGTSGSTAPPPASSTPPAPPPIVDSGAHDTGPPPVVSNKGKVSCGATTCDVSVPQTCCSTDTAPLTGTCGTPDACPEFDAQCDEAADCKGGDICCFGFGKFYCTDAATCGAEGQNIRICKTDAECAGDLNGTTCAAETCSIEGKSTPVRMCGKTDSCK
jgi:hypothetical protein